MKPTPGTFTVVGKNPVAAQVLATLFKAAGWKQVPARRRKKTARK